MTIPAIIINKRKKKPVPPPQLSNQVRKTICTPTNCSTNAIIPKKNRANPIIEYIALFININFQISAKLTTLYRNENFIEMFW